MREFECLDDTLFFQCTERALLTELDRALQLQQGFLVAGETLLPADIGIIRSFTVQAELKIPVNPDVSPAAHH